MTVLTELVRNIILIILLTTFLELIMPSSSMQRFVKVVMGLFVLIAILNPILNVIKQEQNLEAFIWQQEEWSSTQFNSVLEQSEHLQKVNQDLLWENYQQKLELQMNSLVNLISGVEDSAVQVKLQQASERYQESGELIKEVTVTVGKQEAKERREGRIKPVEIVMEEIKVEKIDALSREECLIETKVVQTLSQYFGLKEEQIKVNFI
ncbi:MAG TPA: stage III sporulation protein AF [Clostridia bacterium]|jgi:stage III sporulation protein AF|nr:stage III sporulation protein AF [Clostridia bacterium]